MKKEQLTKENLDTELKTAFDERNKAVAEANGTQDTKLWSEFFKKEIYFNYVTLLYKDLGVFNEIDPEISKFLNPKVYQMSLRDVFYTSPKEEDFTKILEETPHEEVYINYIECSLNQISQLQRGFSQQFSSGKNQLNFTDEKIDEYMEWIDCTYSRPLLILGKLLELKNEKEIDDGVFRVLTKSIQDAFELGSTIDSSNEDQITFLEDVKKGEFKSKRPDIEVNISVIPEKFEELIEKVKFSDAQVKGLYLNVCNLYTEFVLNNPDGVPILINGEKKIWKPENPKA